MPFLDRKIISDQINEFKKGEYDVLIPTVNQYVEPLHAIYKKIVLNDLEKFLSEGKSKVVRDFLHEMNVGYFQVPNTEQNIIAFSNINSPSDIPKTSS